MKTKDEERPTRMASESESLLDRLLRQIYGIHPAPKKMRRAAVVAVVLWIVAFTFDSAASEAVYWRLTIEQWTVGGVGFAVIGIALTAGVRLSEISAKEARDHQENHVAAADHESSCGDEEE